jgi:L-serine dehydratase
MKKMQRAEKVVTAQTNGVAGIIPAMMHYFDKFVRPVDEDIVSRYFLTTAAIGIFLKKYFHLRS